MSDARPSAVDEDTYVKAATTIPDEEELATGAAVASRFRDEEDDDDEFDPELEEAALSRHTEKGEE